MLCMLHGTRFGDFKTALQYANRCSAVSKAIADPAVLALGHAMLGMSLHFSGYLGGARAELEAALRHGPEAQRTSATYLGFNGHILVGAYLARTLWLQGHFDQALQRARLTVRDAQLTDHPVTLCIALVWAIMVFVGTGELSSAKEHVDWLISVAKSHSFEPYIAVGRGFKGQLAIASDDAEGGVESLRSCLRELHAARYEILSTAFKISLAQGLGRIDQFANGMALIDDTIQLVETNGDACYLPELLRVKGTLLRRMSQPRIDDAEMYFVRSLELSRAHGSRAWEVRTATDLAALWTDQARSDDARALLLPVFKQFTEGSATVDLKAAERLLTTVEQGGPVEEENH
jgi:hypothetical protein